MAYYITRMYMLHQEEKVKRSMLKKKNICIFKKDFPLIKTNIDIYWKSNKRGTLLKKSLWHRCFAVNFAKFLRTPFFTEHRRLLLKVQLCSHRNHCRSCITKSWYNKWTWRFLSALILSWTAREYQFLHFILNLEVSGYYQVF